MSIVHCALEIAKGDLSSFEMIYIVSKKKLQSWTIHDKIAKLQPI